jgi:hypothetical protein
MQVTERLKTALRPTPTADRLAETIAKLTEQHKRAESEAAAALAAHANALLDDEDAAFGTAKAAALLRAAGDARERLDSLTFVLAEAKNRQYEAAQNEQRIALRVRWAEAISISEERSKEAVAVAEALAQLANAYARLVDANARLFAAMPNVNTIDLDAGYLRQEQIAGAVKTELARLGCALVPTIEQPHILEHLAEKFNRTAKWVRSLASNGA